MIENMTQLFQDNYLNPSTTVAFLSMLYGNMLFIAQNKVTDHICSNKEILANINVDLKLVCDHFVHRVASSNLPSLVMMIAIG